MNLYKVDYTFKAWPTVYWLNKLCRASLQFVLKKNEYLDFKEEKRLEKMIIIKTSVLGAHIILQINRYLYSVIVHKFFLANKTLKSLFFLGEA